jgi:hypothetical protein
MLNQLGQNSKRAVASAGCDGAQQPACNPELQEIIGASQ